MGMLKWPDINYSGRILVLDLLTLIIELGNEPLNDRGLQFNEYK